MQKFLKVLSIVFLLTVYPVIRFIAHNFVTDSSNEIYAFIPEDSDVIIEINTRNFINEIAYHRIFNESYFNKQLYPDEEAEPVEVEDPGINFFSPIILFREQWADENIWMAVMEYTNETAFTNYMQNELPESTILFGDKYVVAQLSPSDNQEKVDEHLAKIISGEVKSINPKIDLAKEFDPKKEINCYFEPTSENADNQLINGFLSFDFKDRDIKVEGSFTPVSGFEHIHGIAYALNEEAAFSMRSSLNIFNSIYWFSKERIDNVPEYSQMALDYNGVNMFMVDPDINNSFPFKTFPEFQMHFDLYDPVLWQDFFDTIVTQGKINVDTATNQIVTPEGAYFHYNINDNEFELMRNKVELEKIDDDGTCFILHMNVDKMIDNTKLSVDENNPPNFILRSASEAVFESFLEDIRLMTNIDQVNFRMTLINESKIDAEGEVEMKNKGGNSIIESLYFGQGAFEFIKSYLVSPSEE